MDARYHSVLNGNPQRLDRIAILPSGVCLVHCLMAPALVSLLPLVGAAPLSHNHFHLWLLWLILPTSSIALFTVRRRLSWPE